MIRWAVRSAISLFVTAIVLWFCFMVPLGQRTLFEHVMRIARTDEARELGSEVGVAAERLEGEIDRQVSESAREALEADHGDRSLTAGASSTRPRTPSPR